MSEADRLNSGLDVRIEINTETCMGSANCMFWAPGVFLVDDAKNHSTVKDAHGEEIEKVLGAARGWLDPGGASEVQVDGGGKAATAEVIGAGGTDVIVAGSANTRSAAVVTQYPPLAARLPIDTTTGR